MIELHAPAPLATYDPKTPGETKAPADSPASPGPRTPDPAEPLPGPEIRGAVPYDFGLGDIVWTKILNYTAQRQEQSNWCWIATALAVAQFYGLKLTTTQAQVAAALMPSYPSPRNLPGFPSYALAYLGAFARSKPVNSLSYPEVQKEIDAGRPIVLGYTDPGQPVGHAVVIVGYGTLNGTGYILVSDPYEGMKQAKFVEVLFTYSRQLSEVSFSTF